MTSMYIYFLISTNKTLNQASYIYYKYNKLNIVIKTTSGPC